MKIIIATKNKHKFQEIKHILGDIKGYEFFSLNDFKDVPEVIENQDTFTGNAVKKALEMANFTGETVIADDSGLSVDALNGAPGVLSARYAGPEATYEELCKKLLSELKNIPQEKRTARFTTVIAIAKPGSVIETLEGRVEGCITTEMRGTNGFGYDPVFFYLPANKTFAEMSKEEKNNVSHRYRALQKLKGKLTTNSLI